MADEPAAGPPITTKAAQTSINATLPPYELMADTFFIANQACPGKCVIHGAGTPREWDIRKGYGLSGATVVFMGFTVSKFEIDVTIFTQQDFEDWQVYYAKYLRREAVTTSTHPSPEAKQAAVSKEKAAALTLHAQNAYTLAKTQQTNPSLSALDKRRLEQDAVDAANNARDANDNVVTVGNTDAAGSARALGIYHPALAAIGIGSMVVEDVTMFEWDDSAGGFRCTIKCIEYKKPKPILIRLEGSIPGVGPKTPTSKDAFDAHMAETQSEFDHLHDQDVNS